MQIVQYPVKNFTKGRNGYKVRAVVLHITGSSSSSALGGSEGRLGWFSNPASQASSHFLLKEDATVLQLVDEEDTAWHCGLVRNPVWQGLIPGENPNQYTIGVEVAIKKYWLMPSWKQWTTWVELVRWLSVRHNIPMNALGLPNHFEIRADKKCPGYYFSRFYLLLLMKFV